MLSTERDETGGLAIAADSPTVPQGTDKTEGGREATLPPRPQRRGLRAAISMTQGLILLGFLGVLVALLTVRVRRRMGLTSTTKTWLTVIIGFVLVGLTLWAASHG
jgi:hypothetical protein